MSLKVTNGCRWEIYHCSTCDYSFAMLMHFADEEMPESCPICRTDEPDFVGVSEDTLSVKGGLTNA